MVRRILETTERKQPVSVSLTALEIVMLNNLAKLHKVNRSRVLAALIREHSFNELGLTALERHMAPNQTWVSRTHRSLTGEDLRACNPKHMDGRCTHSACEAVYRRLGLI